MSLSKRSFDAVTCDINCSNVLAAAEKIVGAVTVLVSPPGELVVANPVINTAAVTYPDGTTGAIGKVVQVRVSGGKVKTGEVSQDYTVRLQFSTDATPANQLEAAVICTVNDTPDA